MYRSCGAGQLKASRAIESSLFIDTLLLLHAAMLLQSSLLFNLTLPMPLKVNLFLHAHLWILRRWVSILTWVLLLLVLHRQRGARMMRRLCIALLDRCGCRGCGHLISSVKAIASRPMYRALSSILSRRRRNVTWALSECEMPVVRRRLLLGLRVVSGSKLG